MKELYVYRNQVTVYASHQWKCLRPWAPAFAGATISIDGIPASTYRVQSMARGDKGVWTPLVLFPPKPPAPGS